eukprot:CAMPEP_0205824942 /NCGR_PEP_ID=MMETSP0206-20130828/23286_1 /ASSEMBLY_ACC=CAM_ASM_000279 /TAXON_ID=36767 /ORGANISM="Euplotes focardii, Strain TN1" /LENGTH=166 /DNA_ID=CAMNT_0053123535 /DNA_START=260 /DNA_END=760 /DNA_ORIENTATION=+
MEYIKRYYNENGPFDGIIAFSQGGFMARTLLKATECGFPDLQITPKFCMLVGSATPIKHMFKNKNDCDYPCPIMYIYGENDPIIKPHDPAICKRSDSTVIWHKKGHVIPKLTGDHMETFINFYSRFYEEKFGQPMVFEHTFDEDFKKEYIAISANAVKLKQILHKL